MKDITPQEAWNGVKPNVEHFRVWGCLAHTHITDEKRGKLDDKSIVCVLLGFSEESKGYRLYNPQTKKMVISKDVVIKTTLLLGLSYHGMMMTLTRRRVRTRVVM